MLSKNYLIKMIYHGKQKYAHIHSLQSVQHSKSPEAHCPVYFMLSAYLPCPFGWLVTGLLKTELFNIYFLYLVNSET